VNPIRELDPNSLQAATIPVRASEDGAHLNLDQPAATKAIQSFLASKPPPAHGATGRPTTTLPPPPTPTLPPPACQEG
jgi:hypothetical protein